MITGAATRVVQASGEPNPTIRTNTIARPGELELLRAAMRELMLRVIRDADVETLREQCAFALDFGTPAWDKLTWKEVCAEYVDWANMHNIMLYRKMQEVLMSAEIGQRSIDGNRVICDLLVAHASLVVPDFKP